MSRFELHLGPAEQAIVDGLLERAVSERWVERIFERDASLWSEDPEVQAAIADRLGWLDAPAHFTEEIPALEGFGDGVREAGFDTAVVMGMGGSSLAPDVLQRTFGTADGYLDLRILDSTDPDAVAATVDDLDPLETLWLVVSKSGTTTEPLAFQADAWARVEAALHARGSDQRPGEFFAAITDPGASLHAIPQSGEMREVFLNPPDVGGRYSALTNVGLVPASLIGLDLGALLASGTAMLEACRDANPARNTALQLGAAIGGLARAGRDKLTFLTGPAIRSFGAWLEQLLAESTGKLDTGIVPVDLEPLRTVGQYGPDRVFVDIAVAGDAGSGDLATEQRRRKLVDGLVAAGAPVIRIELDDPIDLAGEMVRWELATAIAGVVLGIDPFDQPNVEEAKIRTRRLLAARTGARGEPATPSPAETEAAALSPDHLGVDGLAAALRPALSGAKPPTYVAIQAFIAPSPATDAGIAGLRTALAKTGCATTAGYGPRFLHSTGQLHKGGPATGLFLQITADHPVDRPIPDWPYAFGQLIDAQARGDREALRAHDRPVIQVHLGPDLAAGLATLTSAVERALG